jgi:hypothetical protein
MLKIPLRALVAFAVCWTVAPSVAEAQHAHASDVFEIFYAAEAMHGAGQSKPNAISRPG